MKIGIFDSGIGGLTVLHRALSYLPNEDFLFYADEAHVPYGTKTKEEILEYTTGAVEFLTKAGCRAVVLACNTATSVAVTKLREEFDVPIIGIEPAVKPAIAHANELSAEGGRGGRVLVIATPMTAKEKKLHDLVERVDSHHLVDILATPKLVEFAQKGEFNSPAVENYLKEVFQDTVLSDYSALVLGCTHFNLFKDTLSGFFGTQCQLLDGSEGCARNLAAIVEKEGFAKGECGNVTYFSSGEEVKDETRLAFYRQILERLSEMEKY